VHTTSRPSSRSKDRPGTERGSPIKGIRLTFTVSGAASADFSRAATEKGLVVRSNGGDVTVALTATSPEEALAQLSLLSGLLARKA
jgi:hypothetical protein